ncbi:MAG: tetratricopeptide repeat protein, partial [Myxococcaceae bacterium]|nr:tetratricopeptide repeat protein [Myxococcaceae bacterium]
VVANAKELARVSTLTLEQIRTTGTIAICKFNKLMVTSPKAVLKGYDWLDTLAHEYVHLVVGQKSHNTVPIWLQEGLAKYLESRWRGRAGQAMSPATLALLGERVRKNSLIPFEKMHPSIALLPSAEDAATAFAEVFFAIDYVHRSKGPTGLRTIIDGMRRGKTDRQAVEAAMGTSFTGFERAWLSHVRSQPFPRDLIPRSEEKVVLKDDAKGKAKEKEKKGREISFGDFAEMTEVPARRFAHLGELMRERERPRAAAEEYGKAYELVGDKYESLSNKYALALLELERLDEAQRVLEGSLKVHPGSPTTNVHLGRIHLHRSDWARARDAYLEALASDPFDPEIHLALLRCHGGLGQKALAERTRKAAGLLTGLSGEAVDAVAARLGKSRADLADVPVEARSDERPADAGTTN